MCIACTMHKKKQNGFLVNVNITCCLHCGYRKDPAIQFKSQYKDVYDSNNVNLDFLNTIIEPARETAGESHIRNDVFLSRIKDER
ncbi:Uncharacterised protein [Metakosakonia massiliensis]|uniref:Uncharacterized protein n=1 Tax=Phytobacter massiliensis TaxID=1485952 RepID=A0A6N3G7T7_9ENTR